LPICCTLPAVRPLLRAIDGACRGYPVGDPEPWDDRGFIPAVTVTQEVRQILMGAKIQAIRYHDDIGNWWLGQQAGEVGPLYFILDQSVLRFERMARASEPQEHGPLVSVETERTASLFNGVWLMLDEDAQLAICAVIGACRRRGGAQAVAFRGGHIFAQIDPRGGISWAVNDASDDCVASGVLRLHANQVLCVESLDDLKFLAETWREIGDPYAETQDPARAKALLAAITGDGQAGLAWTARIGGDEAEEACRWLDIIEAQRAAIDVAVTAHRADDLWGRAFDAAESQADTRAKAVSTLAAHLVGLADTAAETEIQAITPELAPGRVRGR